MAETVTEPQHRRRGRPQKPAAIENKPQKPPQKPPIFKKEEASPKAISFFQRMAGIERGDWGTRAKIRIYRLEPVIDNLRVSDTKYIKVFNEPVTEEMIKRDPSCGSGRYRLYLNYKNAAETDRELDSVEIEILDQNFPPRVAKGSWVDDPRNEKWSWAKEHFIKDAPSPTAAADANNTFLHTIEVVDKLRGDRNNPIADALGVMDVAEKIAARNAPAPVTENKTLESIVQLMIAQVNASETRSNTLLTMLLTREKTEHSGSSLKEIVTLVKDDVLPLVEKLRPGAEEAFHNMTRRSRMTGWMEMVQPAIPAALEFFKPFGVALAARLMNPGLNGIPNGAAGAPGQQTTTPGALPQPQTTAADQGSFPPMLNMIAVPLLGYMRMDGDPRELGQLFAEWVDDGYRSEPRFAQALSLAKVAGANSVIVAFKGSRWWLDKGLQNDQPSLAEMEPKFTAFVESFLKWQPTEEDDDSDVIDIRSGEKG